VSPSTLAKNTGILMLIMLAYKINPLTVPSVTVRLRTKSSKTSTIPAIAMGIMRNR